MARTRDLTKEDIYLKARIMSEGLRVDGLELPSFQELQKGVGEVDVPKDLDMKDIDGLLLFYAACLKKESDVYQGTIADTAGITLDETGLRVMVLPNQHSRLELKRDGHKLTISEAGQVVATGRLPRTPAWHNEKLSNGLPVTTVLPFMSKEAINIVFSLSCINYNTGRGCRYCNLFSNPMSRRIVMLPKETLRGWARYQGEAVKIATDAGWRGILAVSGGALPPAHRPEQQERLEILMDEITNAIGSEMLSRLMVVYNLYPPDNFNEMNDWKELGINATCFDLEVMDSAYFPAICPGKAAYKPHQWWKDAQEASVEIFGPYLRTVSIVLKGLEPMHTLVKGIDERLSKGVMPMPALFMSTPGSAYWGFRPPTAEWLVEATDQMTDVYMKHSGKIVKAAVDTVTGGSGIAGVAGAITKRLAGKKKGGGMPQAGNPSNPQSLVTDEIRLRTQGIKGKFSVIGEILKAF
jgi:hypothetical protein